MAFLDGLIILMVSSSFLVQSTLENTLSTLLLAADGITKLCLSENSSVLRQHADLLYRDVRRAAIGLTKVYADLEDCRNQQGYATSPLKYTMDQEDESGLVTSWAGWRSPLFVFPQASVSLLRSLLGKLTMDSPVTPLGALPPAVRTRIGERFLFIFTGFMRIHRRTHNHGLNSSF